MRIFNRRKRSSGALDIALTLFGACVFLLLLAGVVYGWVNNIIIIADTVNVEITGMFIIRVIGIFVAPLGVILGYC